MGLFFGCDKWYSYFIIASNIQYFSIIRFYVYNPAIFFLTNFYSWTQNIFSEKNKLLVSINIYTTWFIYEHDFQWYQCQWKTNMRNRTLETQWNTIFKNNNSKNNTFSHKLILILVNINGNWHRQNRCVL